MTRVLTIGTFDLLHVGHLELLEACRVLAGLDGTVVAAVNDGEFVQRFKGKRPVWTTGDRMAMLRANRYVDLVVRNTGHELAGPIIGRIRPDIIAVGDDWAPPRDYLGQLHITQAFLDARGIRIVYVPRTTGQSSTAIRARMAS